MEDNGFIIYLSGTNLTKIFSKKNGIISGFLKKTNTKYDRYKYQVGNYINFNIIDKNNYKVFEIENNIAFLEKLFSDKVYMAIFNSSIAILNNILTHEQETYDIYKVFYNLMFSHNNKNLLLNYVDFLLNMTSYCGIYLNFSNSIISGSSDIYYISPKTGHCVTKKEGQKYAKDLFIIPKNFLEFNQEKEEIINSINILHYFLYKFCKENNIEYKYRNIKFFKNQLIKLIK